MFSLSISDRCNADAAGADAVSALSSTETGWASRFSARATAQDSSLGAILALAGARDVINFSGGFPDPQTFAHREIAEASARLCRDEPTIAMQYTPSEGLLATREALAAHVGRDAPTPALDELIVTSGGIDALTMIGRTMVDPGDVVLVESPTYVGAVMGLVAVGGEVRAVPTDEHGIDVSALDVIAAEGPTPKLLYVIPDHQNPSGRTLPLERRRALVETCARHHILLVEDVAYRELAFEGGPQPSLWSMDPETVLQIGTFSKTFFPGVRLGWAVGPRDVVAAMAVAKQNTDQCSGALGQRLVQTALTEGWYHPHVEQARRLYAHRGRLLMEAFDEHLAGVAEWTVPDGGFFSWVRIPGAETRALTVEAMADHVAVVPGAGFVGDRPDQEHVRLSYSRIGDDDLREGVRRLRGVVDRHLADAGRGG
jgi:2-aminoadipate transaminase